MTKIIPTPRLIHHAKEVDNEGKFIRWISNPENKGKRTKSTKFTVERIIKKKKFKKNFCFFCGRTQNQLGYKETLTIDHINEISEGGKDRIENVQVLCTACHKLKNWNSTYIRKHLTEKRGSHE